MCVLNEWHETVYQTQLLRDDEQYKSCSFVETTDFVFVEDQSLKDDEHEKLLSVKLVERKELTTKYPDWLYL